MKNKNLRDMFGLIDDDLLEEADPYKIPSGRRASNSLFLKITSLVACILLVLNIVILVPIGIKLNNQNGQIGGALDNTGASTDDTNNDKVVIEYIQNVTNLQMGKPDGTTSTIKLSSPIIGASSEYNELINALEKISNGKIGSLENNMKEQDFKDKNEEVKDEIDDLVSQDKYEETTDNQVSGVIEGDLIKRSDKYIYYLSDTTLKIYSIDQMDSKEVSLYNLEDHIETIEKALEIPEQGKKELRSAVEEIYAQSAPVEIFLSSDCKTVTVVVNIKKAMPSHIYGENDIWLDTDNMLEYTVLLSLNVEDVNNVYLSNIATFFGEYREARLVDNELLVFTEFAPRIKEISVPQYNDGSGFELFPIDKIEVPSKYTTEKYLLTFRLDSTSYNVKDLGAYASFDGDIYVSGENIYITREYLNEVYFDEAAAPPKIQYETIVKPDGTIVDTIITPDYTGWEEHDGKLYKTNEKATDILKISYENGKFKTVGAITLKGYLKDRYSISENGDKLYAVTTELTYSYYRMGKTGSKTRTDIVPRNASLFCIDANEMALISSVERFAPDGEIVRAVRFEGAYAYVCTAVERTDPVFYFDLTYPANITHTNTGTIPGFSTSLIEYGNGTLLGIGEDEDENVKVEVYEEIENKVYITDTFVIDGFASSDYKSYYINREYGLFGFGVWDFSRDEISKYVMLQIKNGYITQVFNVTLRGDNSTKRAVYIDGYFYLISIGDFTVVEKQVSKP